MRQEGTIREGGEHVDPRTGEIVASDAEEEEEHSPERAQLIADHLLKLAAEIESHYVEAGMLLREMRDQELYRELGYESLDIFAENVLRFKPAKVKHLIRVVEVVEKFAITPEERIGLGWSKLLLIGGVMTAANKTEWIERAKRLTTLSLRHAVAQARGRATTDEPMVRFSVVLTQEHLLVVEEAIRLGSLMGDTQNRAVALVCACQEAISTWAPMEGGRPPAAGVGAAAVQAEEASEDFQEEAVEAAQ